MSWMRFEEMHLDGYDTSFIRREKYSVVFMNY